MDPFVDMDPVVGLINVGPTPVISTSMGETFEWKMMLNISKSGTTMLLVVLNPHFNLQHLNQCLNQRRVYAPKVLHVE
jgi:hypothetical protein